MYNSTRITRFLFATFVASIIFPISSYAQTDIHPSVTLYKKVKGWTINQYTYSESSSNPSCSAVHFKNRFDGLRIERFKEGYLYGINGLSRDQQGATYKMSLWFDGNRAKNLFGEATFVRDTAYIQDDWLSHFHPVNEKPGPVEAIAGSNSLSFSFLMPGNRTGNNEVITNFKLYGSAAAILALEECYQVVSSNRLQKISAPQTEVSSCPDDGPRMPLSGICRGRAANYLSLAGGAKPLLMDGCEWVVNETPLPGGDYLFYLASKCGKYLTQLEFSIGARFAEVNILHSAMNQGEPGGKIITVGTVDENDLHKNILHYAQNAMPDKLKAIKCRVVNANSEGWPSDALVVDVSQEEAANAPQGEPRHSCGPFGVDQENTTYWRVFGGFSWFFNLGQDAYLDIDPGSLTIVPSRYDN